MESLGLIVLMSIINCQSINETIFSSISSRYFLSQVPLSLDLTIDPHKFINQSPNESFNFHLDRKSEEEEEEEKTKNFFFNSKKLETKFETQEPHTAPSTTLSRIVETKYGKIQGLSLTLFSNYQGKNYNHPLRNKIVEVFLSIPYASPPVKSQRFSPTQTPLPWDGVRMAVKPGFVCPQVMPEMRDETAALKEMPRGYLEYLRKVEPYLRNQSEDCLYLNIFAPVVISSPNGESEKPKLKPVLLFIHPGKFSWGSGNLYDGTLLSVSADIVFVTINYRLGVLGFLNLNPSPLTRPRVANYGLMDQIAALHWLKENIAAFGGDPESITLMGYESGAASIHFLMSSPAVMEGLFHRAVLIAGSAHAPWAIVEDPAGVANALAESLNCSIPTNIYSSIHPQSNPIPPPHNTTTQSKGNHAQLDPLLDCLKNKHFSYFSKFHPPKFSIDFGPSVDGIVIRPNFKGQSGSELQMGKRDLSPKYDLLFGISSLEMLTTFSESDLAFGFEAPRRDAILRTLVRNSFRFHLNEILATITNEYIDWERSPQHPIATRDLTLNAVTDCLSLAPVISASDSSKINKSYFYVFDHSTKEGLYNYQRAGAGGGEELNYFFGYPILEHGHGVPFYPSPLPSNYTKVEMALSELMITHLSNFIHTGDPNEPIKPDVTWPISKERNKYRNVQWEPYDRLHQKYLEITSNKVRTRSHFRAHQMAIWLRLIPELQRSGAQYASVLHNRMKGGYNPSLYVGSLHLPQELETTLDREAVEGEIEWGYNGTGIPPSPPTTCYSPLSSLASESASRAAAAAGDSTTRNLSNDTTTSHSSTFSPYTTALSLTIAIGCSLLILNVFVFALVYYQRDKKRVEEMMRRKGRRGVGDEENHGTNEEDELKTYGEQPELLKSNSTTATSFHQSQSESLDFGETGVEDGLELNYGITKSTTLSHQPTYFYNDISDMIPSHTDGHVQQSKPHKEVHFSPRPLPPTSSLTTPTIPNSTKTHQSISSNHQTVIYSQQKQLLGIATLPRLHNQPNIMTGRQGQSSQLINHVIEKNTSPTIPTTTTDDTTTLPTKKPPPPTRNFTNYTISQRQIFSLIMSFMTMGIL